MTRLQKDDPQGSPWRHCTLPPLTLRDPSPSPGESSPSGDPAWDRTRCWEGKKGICGASVGKITSFSSSGKADDADGQSSQAQDQVGLEDSLCRQEFASCMSDSVMSDQMSDRMTESGATSMSSSPSSLGSDSLWSCSHAQDDQFQSFALLPETARGLEEGRSRPRAFSSPTQPRISASASFTSSFFPSPPPSPPQSSGSASTSLPLSLSSSASMTPSAGSSLSPCASSSFPSPCAPPSSLLSPRASASPHSPLHPFACDGAYKTTYASTHPSRPPSPSTSTSPSTPSESPLSPSPASSQSSQAFFASSPTSAGALPPRLASPGCTLDWQRLLPSNDDLFRAIHFSRSSVSDRATAGSDPFSAADVDDLEVERDSEEDTGRGSDRDTHLERKHAGAFAAELGRLKGEVEEGGEGEHEQEQEQHGEGDGGGEFGWAKNEDEGNCTMGNRRNAAKAYGYRRRSADQRRYIEREGGRVGRRALGAGGQGKKVEQTTFLGRESVTESAERVNESSTKAAKSRSQDSKRAQKKTRVLRQGFGVESESVVAEKPTWTRKRSSSLTVKRPAPKEREGRSRLIERLMSNRDGARSRSSVLSRKSARDLDEAVAGADRHKASRKASAAGAETKRLTKQRSLKLIEELFAGRVQEKSERRFCSESESDSSFTDFPQGKILWLNREKDKFRKTLDRARAGGKREVDGAHSVAQRVGYPASGPTRAICSAEQQPATACVVSSEATATRDRVDVSAGVEALEQCGRTSPHAQETCPTPQKYLNSNNGSLSTHQIAKTQACEHHSGRSLGRGRCKASRTCAKCDGGSAYKTTADETKQGERGLKRRHSLLQYLFSSFKKESGKSRSQSMNMSLLHDVYSGDKATNEAENNTFSNDSSSPIQHCVNEESPRRGMYTFKNGEEVNAETMLDSSQQRKFSEIERNDLLALAKEEEENLEKERMFKKLLLDEDIQATVGKTGSLSECSTHSVLEKDTSKNTRAVEDAGTRSSQTEREKARKRSQQRLKKQGGGDEGSKGKISEGKNSQVVGEECLREEHDSSIARELSVARESSVGRPGPPAHSISVPQRSEASATACLSSPSTCLHSLPDVPSSLLSLELRRNLGNLFVDEANIGRVTFADQEQFDLLLEKRKSFALVSSHTENQRNFELGVTAGSIVLAVGQFAPSVPLFDDIVCAIQNASWPLTLTFLKAPTTEWASLGVCIEREAGRKRIATRAVRLANGRLHIADIVPETSRKNIFRLRVEASAQASGSAEEEEEAKVAVSRSHRANCDCEEESMHSQRVSFLANKVEAAETQHIKSDKERAEYNPNEVEDSSQKDLTAAQARGSVAHKGRVSSVTSIAKKVVKAKGRHRRARHKSSASTRTSAAATIHAPEKFSAEKLPRKRRERVFDLLGARMRVEKRKSGSKHPLVLALTMHKSRRTFSALCVEDLHPSLEDFYGNAAAGKASCEAGTTFAELSGGKVDPTMLQQELMCGPPLLIEGEEDFVDGYVSLLSSGTSTQSSPCPLSPQMPSHIQASSSKSFSSLSRTSSASKLSFLSFIPSSLSSIVSMPLSPFGANRAASDPNVSLSATSPPVFAGRNTFANEETKPNSRKKSSEEVTVRLYFPSVEKLLDWARSIKLGICMEEGELDQILQDYGRKRYLSCIKWKNEVESQNREARKERKTRRSKELRSRRAVSRKRFESDRFKCAQLTNPGGHRKPSKDKDRKEQREEATNRMRRIDGRVDEEESTSMKVNVDRYSSKQSGQGRRERGRTVSNVVCA